MKAVDAVRRWWHDRHPSVPISHYTPARPREAVEPRDRRATKAPFSKSARRARNRAREHSHAAGQHPSYPRRR